MALEMVHRDQRLIERESQSLGVADADHQRAGKAGSLGDGDGIDRGVSLLRFRQRLPHDGDDCPQVLA